MAQPIITTNDILGVITADHSPHRVDIFTTSAMSATYNNGTSGVGATLTAVGTVTTLDSASLAVGNIVCFAGQATPAQNGIYECLTTGAGAQFRRVTWFDSSAEMINGYCLFVARGANTGQWKRLTSSQPYTIGTTSITFGAVVNDLTNTTGTLSMGGRTIYMNSSSTHTSGGDIYLDGGSLRYVNSIMDTSNITAVEVVNRYLRNAGGSAVIDWSGGGYVGMPLQFNSAASNNPVFGVAIQDAMAAPTIDTNSRTLHDASGSTTLDWSSAFILTSYLPIGIPSFYDYQTNNSSLYWSYDISALAWKDSGGTVHNLESGGGGGGSASGSTGAIQLSNGSGSFTDDYSYFNWDSTSKRLNLGSIYSYGSQPGIVLSPPYGGSGNTTGILVPQYFYGNYPLTLPQDDGTNGYVLSTNGSGVTSWIAMSTSSAGSSGDVQINNGSGGFSAITGASTGSGTTIPVYAGSSGELNSITITNGIITAYSTL